ncbi:MAG: hypothetical protein JWM44_2726 [Bacilli bacterium]|nr:hypothetical protein [Bacilli bacterium]
MAILWTRDQVVHLLNRASFSASKHEVEASLKLGSGETVRRLVAGESLTDQKQELPAISEILSDGKNLDAKKITDQQTYWIYRMVKTQAPLIEKMTLFWHGHFATSYQKVREILFMVQQNELFRKNALGNFHELVLKVGKDPAMMVYLDANSNRKGTPNENYAREVMELFTLGIGNYTEDDVKGAAKSFTGWNVNKDTDEVTFNKKQHDQTNKTVLGETGNFNESDMVDILFKQKALSLFMANKLLQYFAAMNPSQDWINELAADFYDQKTVGEVLSRLFLSERFYVSENRMALVRSPAEYVVGLIRALDLPLSNGFAGAMRKMGQELYLPPDVAGWRGGNAWLMTSSLLARYQFAESVAKRVKPAVISTTDYVPAANSTGASDWVALWARNLNIGALGVQTTTVLDQYANDTFMHAVQKNTGMRGLLQLLMVSPEAQMK